MPRLAALHRRAPVAVVATAAAAAALGRDGAQRRCRRARRNARQTVARVDAIDKWRHSCYRCKTLWISLRYGLRDARVSATLEHGTTEAATAALHAALSLGDRPLATLTT